MKVLLTGATGFIGQAVAEALLAQGHHLVCVLRDPARLRSREGVARHRVQPIALDFSKALSPADWRAALEGVEVVVNTVGIFQEASGKRGRGIQPGQSFDFLHTRAPIALFDAAAQAGVRLIVQVSALGADAGAQSAFHLSKRAADDHLRRLGVPALIAQPSLVYGPGGASAALFNRLAALPVRVLPRLPPPGVQPVLLDDVVRGVVKALEPAQALGNSGCRTLAFVGPEAMPLSVYLARLRCTLGWQRPAGLIELSWPLVQAAARAAQHVPGLSTAAFLDPDALAMLARGNAADPAPFASLLGRAPQPVEAFVDPRHAPAFRHSALLLIWQPVLRISVALVWLWTGVVSMGLYPIQDSLALLARVGAHGALAWLLLYGAALLDLALGVATLISPKLPPPWRGRLWAAQIALITGYTALISWRLPEFWLHPYGPLLKNLPMLAAIGLLWSLEPPARKRQGGLRL